jgi:hypothetical protein
VLIGLGIAGLVGSALIATGGSLGVGVGFVQRLTVYGTVIGIVASGWIVRDIARHDALTFREESGTPTSLPRASG